MFSLPFSQSVNQSVRQSQSLFYQLPSTDLTILLTWTTSEILLRERAFSYLHFLFLWNKKHTRTHTLIQLTVPLLFSLNNIFLNNTIRSVIHYICIFGPICALRQYKRANMKRWIRAEAAAWLVLWLVVIGHRSGRKF